MELTKEQIEFFTKALRRASYTWKYRAIAKKKAKIKIGEFKSGRPRFGLQCANCKQGFMVKDVDLDHIAPVMPVYGFLNGQKFDANEYIARLLCYEKGWNVLCKKCHQNKSNIENDERRRHIQNCIQKYPNNKKSVKRSKISTKKFKNNKKRS